MNVYELKTAFMFIQESTEASSTRNYNQQLVEEINNKYLQSDENAFKSIIQVLRNMDPDVDYSDQSCKQLLHICWNIFMDDKKFSMSGSAMMSLSSKSPDVMWKYFSNDKIDFTSFVRETVKTALKENNVQSQSLKKNQVILSNLVVNLLKTWHENQDEYKESLEHIIDVLVDDIQDVSFVLVECFKDDNGLKAIIDVVAKKSKNLTQNDCDAATAGSESYKAHRLMLSMMKGTFYGRKYFQESYLKMSQLMLITHGYENDAVAKCVEREEVFEQPIKIQLIESLHGNAPKISPAASFGGWLALNMVVAFLSFWNLLATTGDLGSDIKLAEEYGDWTNFKNQYNCTISNNASLGNAMECSIIHLDELLPVQWSILVLIITQILQLIHLAIRLLKKEDDEGFQTMFRFFLGTCCKDRKLDWFRWVLQLPLFLLIGLILPIATTLYTSFIVPPLIYQFEKNLEIHEEFKKNGLNAEKSGHFPIRSKMHHHCSVCDGCQNKDCFCSYCGYTVSEILSTVNQYISKLSTMRSNLTNIEGLNRYLTSSIENTYAPLLQLYLVIPLLPRYFSPPSSVDQKTTDSESDSLNLEDARDYTIFLSTVSWTIFSIVGSIVSQATALTAIHFSWPKKQPLNENPKLKYMFFLATILQVSARLITLEIFGLIIWPESSLTPVWLLLICWGHVLVVHLMKMGIMHHYGELNGRSSMNSMVSAFGSVYTYVKWDFFKTGDDNTKKDLRNDAERRNVEQSKFWQRCSYTSWIWIQQIVMVCTICLVDVIPLQFNRKMFVGVLSAVFLAGQVIEWIFHFMNPLSSYRIRQWRKKVLYLSVFLSFFVGIYIMPFALGWLQPGDSYFIFYITCSMVFLMTILLSSCCLMRCIFSQKHHKVE